MTLDCCMSYQKNLAWSSSPKYLSSQGSKYFKDDATIGPQDTLLVACGACGQLAFSFRYKEAMEHKIFPTVHGAEALRKHDCSDLKAHHRKSVLCYQQGVGFPQIALGRILCGQWFGKFVETTGAESRGGAKNWDEASLLRATPHIGTLLLAWWIFLTALASWYLLSQRKVSWTTVLTQGLFWSVPLFPFVLKLNEGVLVICSMYCSLSMYCKWWVSREREG